MIKDVVLGQLRHIRSIHFWLILVTCAIFYLVASAWTDAPEVYEQLRKFETTVQRLRHANDKPYFTELMGNDWVNARRKRILKILDIPIEQTRPSVDLVKASMRVTKGPAKYPDPNVSTLEKLRQTLEEGWYLEQIKTIKISPEIRQWLAKYPPLSLVGSALKSVVRSGPYLVKFEPRWAKEPNMQQELTLGLEIVDVYTSSVDSSPKFYTYTKNWNDVEFESVTFRLPPRWFEETYPQLCANWDDLKRMNLARAITDTEDRIAAPLEERDLTILPLKIHGKDIGYLGPTIISVVLLYILGSLKHLEKCVAGGTAIPKEERILLLSMWIGTRPGACWRIVTVLTLTGIPALTVWLTLWRVLRSNVLSVCVAVLVAIIGIACSSLCSKIR